MVSKVIIPFLEQLYCMNMRTCTCNFLRALPPHNVDSLMGFSLLPPHHLYICTVYTHTAPLVKVIDYELSFALCLSICGSTESIEALWVMGCTHNEERGLEA